MNESYEDEYDNSNQTFGKRTILGTAWMYQS